MRKVTVVLLVATVAVLGCSKKDAGDTENAVATSDRSTSPIVVREAGLRFDPPSTWPPGRFRVEVKSGDEAAEQQPGATHWVAMHYQPDQPGHREASLCRFVVFSHDEWRRIEGDAEPPVGTLIESAEAWVYLAQLPQSNPYPSESLDATQFDAMRLSIRDVRARFSIEGDGPAAVPATGEL